MKIKEMNEIVNMLDKEWDLGKKSSQSKGKYVLGYTCFKS